MRSAITQLQTGLSTLSLFQSYLENKTQFVAIQGRHSMPAHLHYGVPQEYVLEPIHFIIYTKPLSNAIKYYPVFHQIYANDTQIYKACRSYEIVNTFHGIEQCISNGKTWMYDNTLQMIPNKG